MADLRFSRFPGGPHDICPQAGMSYLGGGEWRGESTILKRHPKREDCISRFASCYIHVLSDDTTDPLVSD